jgi:phage virion morphogenesis protein
MRDIALEPRRRQQRRIAAQKNPDGSACEPRKAKPVTKKAREKRGWIKHRAMFAKMRTMRWLKVETESDGFAIGFAGRVARIARVHQFGELAPVASGEPEYRYPERTLLGLTITDRFAIRDRLLSRLTDIRN